MEKAASHVFSERVLSFLHENAGTKYSVASLAQQFNANVEEMRKLLRHLHETSQVKTILGYTQYYLIAKRAQPISSATSIENVSRFKPYIQPKQLGERCSELYPKNHGFITVKADD